MDKLPVVYVRGYAGATTGIDTAVDDPFYGFNSGGTHVRVDGDGSPTFYQFEGPMLRLMIDEGYQLLVRGGQDAYLKSIADGGLSNAQASIWVYRFYDTAADTFNAPPKRPFLDGLFHHVETQVSAPGFNIEVAATGLYDFIKEILAKTGAPKVNLVAHSMGGLVARCMLQKISQTPDGDQPRTPGAELVDRFFTYATPHGGIVFTAGALNQLEQVVGPAGSAIFSPPNMYGYLTKGAKWGDEPPPGWDPRAVPPEIFDPDRIFCLVGTDPQDYGLSRVVVGPQSDGLVRIPDAQLTNPDTHRAYVYRSHSGRYGIVNSEEGYQNLRRFLFGRYQVAIRFGGLDIASTGADTAEDADADAKWQADLRMSVRGLPVVMDEQLAAHYCPIELTAELAAQAGPAGLVPLTSVFLLTPGSGQGPVPTRCRFALQLRVFRVVERSGFFDFSYHLEQIADWDDTLIADIGYPDDAATTGEPQVWAAWNSAVSGVLAKTDPIQDKSLELAGTGYEIQLPETARAILGASSTLCFTVTERLPIGAAPGVRSA
jgi:pimeloyl-ACP methyl ester carboxylesterase